MRRDVIATDTALLPVFAGQHHLALIAGLPCSQSHLIADLCRDLLARQHGGCELIVIKDLDSSTRESLAAATGPILLFAEGADAALETAAREGAFPVVVLNQRFSAAAHDYLATRQASLQDTMRAVVRAQIGIEGLAAIPRATVIDLRPDEQASVLFERIAAALSLSVEQVAPLVADRGLARPLAAMLEDAAPSGDAAAADTAADTAADEADGMFRTLEAFYGFHPEGSGGTLHVPLEALLDGAPPHLPATEVIDLTGVPRCLTFGPYFHLPRGNWKVRFTFHSGGNASGNTLGFDVAVDQEIKVDQYFEVTASGKFAFECDFAVDDPYSYLEFRTYVLRGSIGGQFRALSLTIERSADDPAGRLSS